MYYDFLVKIPENTGKISKNKRKDVTYIEYTYDRKYIPEKKYNVPLRTTVYTDQIEHTARRFSAWLPPIQCTLSGHQCMMIIQG